MWCWRRFLRVPQTKRRSNQSILKEINPEYSLEGLMLKLKLQYLGHLMWRANSLEKILMLGKIEGKRRKGQERMLLLLLSHFSHVPPGSPIPGILQARTLEWVAISFSNAWKWKGKVKSLSRVRLFATPWTAAYQAPPSMGFSSKSTGVGCHCLLRGEYEMVR